MSALVFLDTETTGLHPERHEVWEIAYGFEDGRIESGEVKHDLFTADFHGARTQWLLEPRQSTCWHGV